LHGNLGVIRTKLQEKKKHLGKKQQNTTNKNSKRTEKLKCAGQHYNQQIVKKNKK